MLKPGVLLFLCLAALARAADSDPLPKVVQFNRDIRPILSDNCFHCHGPDKATRKAGLRLDLEAEATAPRKGKHPVLRGQPDASEVIKRILTTDEDDKMPPAESGKKLTGRQVALLKLWVQQGAKWEAHWAFLPPQRPEVPRVKGKKPANPIDSFVLAELEKRSWKPSPEAGKRTLIRRLKIDLLGLPPTPAEVDAFLADKSSGAYDKLVDKFLAAPQFGERMAARWLDWVRYADTVGYHGDQLVNVWPYRDYVIKSFNANKRFDQFTIEQIAGDLLPNATTEQKVASGYNRLHMMTGEGGAQDKEYRAKYAADRVRNTSTVWMGTTMGCAECHDHKFDPISAKDFYRFEAIFADLKEKGYYPGGDWEPRLSLPSEEQTLEMRKLEATLAELRKTLEAPSEQLAKAQLAWEEETRASIASSQGGWLGVVPATMKSLAGTKLKAQPDQSVLTSGPKPANENYELTIATEHTNITAFRLEALTHKSFANKSLTRGGNGNFVLTGVEAEVQGPGEAVSKQIRIARALADYEQGGWPVAATLDDRTNTGWAVDGFTQPANRQAVFIFAEPLPGGPGTTLTLRLKHESAHHEHIIGRFRLGLTSQPDPAVSSGSLPEKIFTILHLPAEERSDEQKIEIARHFRASAPELAATRKGVEELTKKKDELNRQVPTTLVSVSQAPRDIRILPRGNWMDDSGEIVAPGIPEAFPQPKIVGERFTRMDLARWLVSAENPLTARVFVNRLWKLYFGTGLSKNLDDLGAQGEWPTHPELLDWLAIEFREKDWDMKGLIKLFVTSRTYKQSSLVSDAMLEADPFNRYLARQSRWRLEAEIVRDNALAVSGLLSPTMFGPSAKPYQPAGYYAQLNFPKREYEADKGDNQYRRGVYTHWQRTFLHPMLLAFDAPSREECAVERPRSNTPLQSLTLLNDPTFVEAARAFAAKVVQQGGGSERGRVTRAYQWALSREPGKEEARTLTKLYRSHLEKFKADPEAAKQLLATGDAPLPKDIDPVELAAWTSVTRTILNLHETIMRF